MPSNSSEYMSKYMKKYRTTEKQHENMMRMRIRRKLAKEWRVTEGDKRFEVDHIKWVKAGNGKSNIRIISRTLNRKLWAIKANRGR